MHEVMYFEVCPDGEKLTSYMVVQSSDLMTALYCLCLGRQSQEELEKLVAKRDQKHYFVCVSGYCKIEELINQINGKEPNNVS